MDRLKTSFDMGERLKRLRENKGLSYPQLKRLFAEEYGINISVDSLRDYEISQPHRSKATKLPNLGMRLEYLYVFADIYQVSTDYILGLSDTPTQSEDIRAVCAYTGLSVEAVNFLKNIDEESRKFISSFFAAPVSFALHRLSQAVAMGKTAKTDYSELLKHQAEHDTEDFFSIDKRTLSRVLMNEATDALHGLLWQIYTHEVYNGINEADDN